MAEVADTNLDAPPTLESRETLETISKMETKKTDAEAELEKLLAEADNTNGTDKDEGNQLDELSSLEQEIAKMHNTQHVAEEAKVESAPNTGQTSGSVISGTDKDSLEVKPSDEHAEQQEKGYPNEGRSESALEEVDLIALLKGSDSAEAEMDKIDEGVTIEGEGQYEIMEIDDDDNSPAAESNNANKTSSKVSAVSAFGKNKLSPEQARAVALEQIADLKSRKLPRKDSNNPLVIVKPQDIVSSLNDDWNEYDSGSDTATPKAIQLAVKKPAAQKKIKIEEPKPVISTVKVVLKAIQKPLEKEKAKAKVPNVPTTAKTELPSATTAETTTGFKRMRVIKRKIIWDPDVPETQKSFAQYASSKGSATPPPALATPQVQANSSAVVARKETAPKKPRAATPKELNKTPAKRAATPSKALAVNMEGSAPSPPKRRSQTPSVGAVPNGSAKKKKVSEIDRLMGDEGAANMIQSVEHEQRELSGGEISNKPLMRKRAMTITGRPARLTAESQAVTPKKETPTKRVTAAPESVFDKTPVTKPRASESWDYVYKQRASEESMIMRRRSNSSYSSNASVTRVSLDNKPGANLSDDAADVSNDPSFKFLKPENKVNNQRSANAANPQTLTNDLKRSSTQTKESKTELIVLNKVDKIAHLVINTHRGKTEHTYNAQLLHKLSETLTKLAKSNEYNTVLLTVQGQHYCQGIDCQELIAGALEKRKNCASQMGSAIKTYLRTLATFPKPLVAGIVGNLKNLGVMQLPLFDYVVAADDCCFEIKYNKIGQLPEGYALWHKHEKVSSQLHARLILLGERLHTADLSTPNSLIDKTCQIRNVNDEALAAAKLISTTSAETYRILKRLNHTVTNTANLPRLEEEFKIITEQWVTANCQANLKRYQNDIDF